MGTPPLLLHPRSTFFVAVQTLSGGRGERLREAVQLARQLGISMVIPCHFDMFTFNTETPDEFLQQAGEQGQGGQVLQCGERFSSHQILSGSGQ